MSAAEKSPPAAAPRSPANRRGAGPWNFLTALVLLLTILSAAALAWVFVDPSAPLNPFPPPTMPAVMAILTFTPGPPTGTPPPTSTPPPLATSTVTPSPTATFTPTATFQPLVDVSPSPTLRATATPGGYAFIPQEGSPDTIPYRIYSDVGCEFMGVGGRVLGLDGSPITPGVIVRLSGNLEGRRVNLDTLSGTATQFGESGFVFELADHPIATRQAFYVQLLDQAYLPMSGRITFDTFEDCERNLIFITFRQMR